MALAIDVVALEQQGWRGAVQISIGRGQARRRDHSARITVARGTAASAGQIVVQRGALIALESHRIGQTRALSADPVADTRRPIRAQMVAHAALAGADSCVTEEAV